ncbi:MAG: hypothetical protein PHV13_05410 [Candidatus ainarchaeum sp.]|nr:hypothetical protein [Candidatus ainarchaeum sp.]
MKFSTIDKTGRQGAAKAATAFAGAALMVAGLAVLGAHGGDCARKNGIETVTICDSSATVQQGGLVAKKEFNFGQPASISWKVAGIDSSGVTLAYEMNAVFDADVMKLQDTATVAYGQDTVVSAQGRDPLRIRVEKGADANSASITASFPK